MNGKLHNRKTAYATARTYLERAIALNPNDGRNHLELSRAHAGEGNIDLAIKMLERIAAEHPGAPEVMRPLANLLMMQKKYFEAASCWLQILKVEPDDINVRVQLSGCLSNAGKYHEVEEICLDSIEKGLDNTAIRFNLGTAYNASGRDEEAMSAFKAALEDPKHGGIALMNLASVIAKSCAWDEIEDIHSRALKMVTAAMRERKTLTLRPFTALNMDIPLEVQRDITAHFVRSEVSFPEEPWFTAKTSIDTNKLRIGYLSSDVRDHAVFHLANNLFKHHDRDRFTIHCYSSGPDDGSAFRTHAEATCDKFIDISDLATRAASTVIFEDGIDILIDMSGHTSMNRADVLAAKPAPVQAHFLGYPGTLAMSTVDYFFTDRYLTPPGSEKAFTERLVYMPDTYQICDDEQRPAEGDVSRREEGLPEQSFVFCSFNASYKIDRSIFDSWMAILAQVPDSVLWLLSSSELVKERLKQEAADRGVDPERIVFAIRQPKRQHLARHRLADLFLDTSTVCGHTTVNDALQMGLPVLSLPRDALISRVSSSLLQAYGLSQFISVNSEEYIKKAVAFASDRRELRDATESLRSRLSSIPARDTERFVRNLELAYVKMAELHNAGVRNEHIDVSRLM